jgi:hypothetical protein
MAIRDELLKELLAEYKKPEDLLGPNGLLKQLTGALVEKALQAEMTEHLGYEKHAPAGRGSGNSRNGASGKTLKTEAGEVAIEVPRDRNATFEPQLVKKHQTHFDGFDDKIISMYARGMTVREIQGHLKELYGTEVSPDLSRRPRRSSDSRARVHHCVAHLALPPRAQHLEDQGLSSMNLLEVETIIETRRFSMIVSSADCRQPSGV